ncbi:bile acid:sodium symporter family protein [Pelosinus propionicus]|uniref:Bile acid:Na+ symporter, BASS family n=1 Tax=Pelosinus propionicus DSM 13327 TaxID=1123291 RepID=A0A1I4MGC5_9FIRM|nr:bile acid:sodium symporter family protein [Pelosinus propionicus]SFM02105.1 bile acid:Na+ symporter, BASS family [Pelosinus propionicus DSM 13327]
MAFIERLSKLITQYFPLWVIVFAAAAFFQPAPFKPIGTYIPYLLGLIMLGMGLTMSLNDFKLVLTRPKDVFFGILLRYLIMPAVAFGVAKLLSLPPALAAGLILVGACPSGTASNVMTFIAKGDTALSVTVSSFNTILAPLLTPFIFLYLAGTMIPIQAGALLVDILKIVLLPVFLGIALRMLASSFVESFNKAIPAFSVVAIIMIITAVVALNATKLVTIAGMAFLAVILHNSIGLFLGYITSKSVGMGEGKARAISFEIGMENSGLAVALAMAHLDPIAAIPGAIFSVWHNFSGSILAGYWSSRKITEEKTNFKT